MAKNEAPPEHPRRPEVTPSQIKALEKALELQQRRTYELGAEADMLQRQADATKDVAAAEELRNAAEEKKIAQKAILAQVLRNEIELARHLKSLTEEELEAMEKQATAAALYVSQQQRITAANKQVSASAKSFVTVLTGVNDSTINSAKAFLQAEGGLKRFAKGIFRVETLSRVLIGASVKLAQSMIAVAIATDKSTESVRKGLGVGKQYDRQIEQQTRAMFHYGVMADETAAAFKSLYATHMDFTKLSEPMQKSLMTGISQLGELGASTDSTAAIMNNFTKGLGASAAEVDNLSQYMLNIANSVDKPVSAVVEDMKSASVRLSFYGTRMKKVFEGLQFQSKNTGLSVDKLLDVTQQFDTFEGAATSVGRLNAILGGPYLNSIDMLNMSEEQRVSTIQRSVKMAGVQIDQLGKYERMAIASALGTDVDTAMKMLRGMTGEERKRVREQKKLADAARAAQGVMTKMKLIFYQLATTLEPLMKEIGKVVDLLAKAAKKYTETIGKWSPEAQVAAGVGTVGREEHLNSC